MNEALRNGFLLEIFSVADKVKMSNNISYTMELCDDAIKIYNKHFERLLNEKSVRDERDRINRIREVNSKNDCKFKPFEIDFPSEQIVNYTIMLQKLITFRLKLYEMVNISKSNKAKEAYRYVITELSSIITD